MSDLGLSIAGVRLTLRGDKKTIARAGKRYAAYRSNGRADMVIDWEEGTPPKNRRWPFPEVERRGSRLTFARRDFHAEFRGRKGTAITNGLPMAIDSLLRILIADILAERGGVLVHAAGIGNWLFPGRSGAGKSTLGRLAPRARVLSDELIAVTPRGKRFEIHGTPFWGGFARGKNTERHPLHTIYFLDRKKREFVEEIGASEAALRMLECVLCFREDRQRSADVLRAVTKLVTAVPTYRLSYDRKKTGYRELKKRLT